MQVVCAIAPLKETNHSVVLSADVVADLECTPALSVMCVKVQSCDDNVECQSCNSYVNDCMVAKVDASNDDDDESAVSVVDNVDQLLVNDVADGSEQLIKAQPDDPTLASCWEMAKANKGNFVVDHGLLFHYDQVEGQKFVSCVCLSVNVIPYFSWPMILYLAVSYTHLTLPTKRIV